MSLRRTALLAIAAAVPLVALVAPGGAVRATSLTDALSAGRNAEPVVLTGAQIPSWSRLPAEGAANPYPSGALDGVRDAHNGTLVVPPDTRTGVDPSQIAAYRWNGHHFAEVPVQVDQ